ncbi:ATPase [soil metagenome]
MSSVKLIADSGSTKTHWCILSGNKKKYVTTQGMSPYFLSAGEMMQILSTELLPDIKNKIISSVSFYGTGCSTVAHAKVVKSALKKTFPNADISVDHDLIGAAKAVCGDKKGIVCILGTGSNSCYYNGKKIVKNSPGLGYILGDEGSGAYLGKKVIQYYLYETFDEDLRSRFDAKFVTNSSEILSNVYKQPLANRYLASFSVFLAENRGHFMIENIIEDGINDFFFTHICKYNESWTLPISFVGGIAHEFRDVIKELCASYEIELGTILKSPLDGLISYHK